jgi:hypothetical protein
MHLVAALLIITLIVGAAASAARGAPSLGSQATFADNDPSGYGESTFTVLYSLPHQVQVGTNLTVPIELMVDNLTKLMAFVQDYEISISLALSDGKQLSGQVGVTQEESGTNASLQLHTGQEWGVTNITLPLTPESTGLSQGQEVLGNATLTLRADIWFDPPVNAARPEENQSRIGYVLIASGVHAGPQPNFFGFALVALGAILLVIALVVTRGKKDSKSEAGPDEGRPQGRPPGAV